MNLGKMFTKSKPHQDEKVYRSLRFSDMEYVGSGVDYCGKASSHGDTLLCLHGPFSRAETQMAGAPFSPVTQDAGGENLSDPKERHCKDLRVQYVLK